MYSEESAVSAGNLSSAAEFLFFDHSVFISADGTQDAALHFLTV